MIVIGWIPDLEFLSERVFFKENLITDGVTNLF